MRFENPLIIIYIIWSIPIMALFWLAVMRRRRHLIETFIEKPLLAQMPSSLNIRRQYIKTIFISISVLLLLFALARPQWGFRWEQTMRKGLDMIIAVDVSRSMLADDIKPSRLERTKLAIRDMVGKFKGDRIGLIAFAGTAFMQSPLTLDYDGFLLSLEDLGVETIPRGGTSITAAIEEAIRGYEPGERKYRVLVIISDGEDHEGDAIKAAKEAKEQKIKIFCIGIGTPEGSPIMIKDGQGRTTLLKDEYGRVVRSRLNEELLKQLAFITGGSYVRSSRTQFGLETIYEEKISQLEKREVKGDLRKRYYERFQIPLALAIILLCAELTIIERRRI